MNLPNVLLTGREGQLGTVFSELWNCSALRDRFLLVGAARQDLDITNSTEVDAYLSELRPKYILNTAAYTRVDDAESEVDAAIHVNDLAVGLLASWCSLNACRLIHISTDFVFDGESKKPYEVDAPAKPLGVYGSSKLAGERHIAQKLPTDGIIVRTSWLYSEHGRNFVKTMLGLMSEGRDVRVVCDQIGSPTSAHTLCKYIVQLIAADRTAGIYHFTDGGELSWYEFAVAIREIGIDLGLITGQATVTPVPTSDYPTAARRPPYSVLELPPIETPDRGGTPSWRAELRSVLGRIKAGSSGR